MTPSPTARPAPAGQWRLAEVQLANWGTFDGAIYRVPVARRGHLITGPSGSGKSSLLDAIAAVLTPDKWLRLNQAAQGPSASADRRSLLSYVRGAWSRTVDETEDRVVSSYLRPRATWSGIVLTFEDGTGQTLSLARLFFLRASGSTTTDLNDLCLLERSAVDLADLQEFVAGGLEARKLQQRWPDALVTTNHGHGRFYARLRSVVGMADETALQLLHKTQSAKNLDSLDQLFREHMLERPGTFDLASTAVTQFVELRSAHARVVELREQRDELTVLRDHASRYDAAKELVEAAQSLMDAVEPYQLRRRLAAARDELESLTGQVVVLETESSGSQERLREAQRALREAERRELDLGGAESAHLRERIEEAQVRAAEVDRRWSRFDADLREVGVAGAPTNSAGFAELMTSIAGLLERDESAPGPSHEQLDELSRARRRVRDLDAEIESVRRHRSTVPTDLLAVRGSLARELGVPESALPFAAELVEVAPDHARWRGAIERVLRPLALTLLVRSEHLPAVREWLDSHHLGTRLVLEEVGEGGGGTRRARSPQSLLHRVVVREGAFGTWVQGRLSERYDLACVEAPAELAQHDRAVTINGQVRASRTRYEKDDRHRIDDRSRWILGHPGERLELLAGQHAEATRRLAEITGVVDRLAAEQAAQARRRGALTTLRHQTWPEIDRVAAQAGVGELTRRLAVLTESSAALAGAAQATAAARVLADTLADEHQTLLVRLGTTRRAADDLRQEVEDDEAEIAAGRVDEVDAEKVARLDDRFRVRRTVTRSALAEVGMQVLRTLQGERDAAVDDGRRAGEELVSVATRFSTTWPQAAPDLSPSVDDRAGYLRLLDEIVAHGLPEHEASFLRLLRERSRDLIGELVSDILSAPREIEERVAPVNDSLRRSPFDVGTYLRLRVKTRRTETVSRFIADLRSVSEGGWGEDDLAAAERRFETLAELMRRFGSSEHVDRTWRQMCLDTRQHVTFLAEEIDGEGRVLATFDSGAAMSGGQQQKLVIFCLAAALRYQLADPDEPFPRYGTIVLDEAFDKADTRYTRMALDVFVEFGFQMILATPQKLLQTIEPYVDGTTSIENPDRRRSLVANLQWGAEEGGG